MDDYGQKIGEGLTYLKGHYMEESKSVKDGCFYKIDGKRKSLFFRERIVNPFVSFQERKNGHFLPVLI